MTHPLLKIKEKISGNPSSVQIAKTLDELLFKCVEPVIRNTHYMEYVLVELLPHVFMNQRRKFSNKPLDQLRDAIFTIIMTDNIEEKCILLKKQGLERNIYFTAFSYLEKYALEYLAEINTQLKIIHNGKKYCSDKLIEIEKKFFSQRDFFETVQSTMFWLDCAYEFKGMITEKYVRYAWNESIKMENSTDLFIDQYDLFKDLLVSISKAIDKYDVEKGPLTSYISLWFTEAKTSYRNTHEYSVAYSIPPEQRKKTLSDNTGSGNFTLELNESIAESTEDLDQDILGNIISNEDEVLVHNIACRADKYKIYCLLNNIEYTLTDKDKEIQKLSLETM
jgi:hypothetical protein